MRDSEREAQLYPSSELESLLSQRKGVTRLDLEVRLTCAIQFVGLGKKGNMEADRGSHL